MGINERKPLGKILEEMKAASAKSIKDALKLQHENPGKKLGEILIEQKVCSQVQVTEALAKQFNLVFMRLEDLEVEAELTQMVPKQVCDDYKICPVKKNGRSGLEAGHGAEFRRVSLAAREKFLPRAHRYHGQGEHPERQGDDEADSSPRIGRFAHNLRLVPLP